VDEDMSPSFLAMFLVTGRNGIVGGDWTVLGIMGIFWYLEPFRRDR